MRRPPLIPSLLVVLALPGALASYVNFESSHVHPIALTPSGARLLAVNTPDAVLEIFTVGPDGTLDSERSVPVGLEPVSVAIRDESEAWVVNQISDSVSIVDLEAGAVVRTLLVGDEPTDVVFAAGKAFVSVAGENAIKVYDLSNLDAPPQALSLFTQKPRALAVAPGGSRVYAVPLFSGNRTTVVNAAIIFNAGLAISPARLAALGLNGIACNGAPPPYPPLPPGITRNPGLFDPPAGQHPRVGLIVRWDGIAERWVDDAAQDWTHCLPYRLPDHDLFAIDTTNLAVQTVDGLGTTLFDVAINPADGRIWVPHTEARNFVRFEHPLGVQGHVVDNRVAIVDPSQGFSKSFLDLNAHIDRGSDPATNLAERAASISQPGALAWDEQGTTGYMTGIGTRKLFRVDGACAAPACIFGPVRSTPAAVEVGQGPTGVALSPAAERAYVLLRFDNAIAVVDTASMAKVGEIPLHDPSPAAVRADRRFLYDAIDGSGHGDAACSSCHISGDRDGLAWDLGNPAGESVGYLTQKDNVRFVVPVGGVPAECPPEFCASHGGFDPQKGPMTTQTLRGMLEPLHWRGDRATMNDFNAAFPDLMGTADIGPVNGKPAGLSAPDMEAFRQFALGIAFPPNPLRQLDDTLPDFAVPVPGTPFDGNPTRGALIFDTFPTDANQPCRACHTHPFGAGGGTLGGVTPQDPTGPGASALFNGNADGSLHSDLKIPHVRNMYEKIGPVFGTTASPVESRSGFGYTHDGAIPDLGTFFSATVFNLTAQDVRDTSAFMAHFPTGTRPAVGAQVTVPPGAPGKGGDEQRLATLIALGDAANPGRHCELTAWTVMGGRPRGFHLIGGVWAPDAGREAPIDTTALREGSEAPISFLCATLGSGVRLGIDRDGDLVLNADDCATGDPETWSPPSEVTGLAVHASGVPTLEWDDQAAATGPSLRYEVVGSTLAELRESGPEGAPALALGLVLPRYTDPRQDPAPGAGYWYLVHATNPCAD